MRKYVCQGIGAGRDLKHTHTLMQTKLININTYIVCLYRNNKANSCNNQKKTIQYNGNAYIYTIKVVDTDLKNVTKIPHWYDLDQRIVEHAIQHNFTKVCRE